MRRAAAPSDQPTVAGGGKEKGHEGVASDKGSFMACGGRCFPPRLPDVGLAFVSEGSEVQILPGGPADPSGKDAVSLSLLRPNCKVRYE